MTLPRSFALFAALSAFLGSHASAQTQLHIFDGESVLQDFAEAVDGAGDVNGDGHDDVIVGIPGFDQGFVNVGGARVFSGKDGSILHELVGGAGNEQFGEAVSGAGDVDNDGFADVIVGAWRANYAGNQTGRARVHSGATGALLHTFDGGFAARLAWSVSEVGDVDADGHDDLVVGAPNSSLSFGGAGSVFVFSGKTGATLHTWNGDVFQDNLGTSASGAGDVDNDGRPDVIGGAPGADPNGLVVAGLARVWSGATGATLYTFVGAGNFDDLGGVVSGAGDVNGDGHDDVMASALDGDLNGGPAGGYVRVYSGADGAILQSFASSAAGEEFGQAIAGLGDVNGDGRSDVLITAPYSNGALGAAFVFSGADGATLIDLPGSFANPLIGRFGGAAGDVNNDGTPDFVVDSTKNAGVAWVLSGKNITPPNAPFGAGCPGSGGVVPELAMVGATSAGGHLSLRIDGGESSGAALLLGGLTEVSLPAGCGCSLLVQPVALQLPLTLSPLGCLLAGFDLPPGLGGVTVKLQALVGAAGSACGFAATNGVSVTFQ